jgi:hypothetical protein
MSKGQLGGSCWCSLRTNFGHQFDQKIRRTSTPHLHIYLIIIPFPHVPWKLELCRKLSRNGGKTHPWIHSKKHRANRTHRSASHGSKSLLEQATSLGQTQVTLRSHQGPHVNHPDKAEVGWGQAWFVRTSFGSTALPLPCGASPLHLKVGSPWLQLFARQEDPIGTPINMRGAVPIEDTPQVALVLSP